MRGNVYMVKCPLCKRAEITMRLWDLVVARLRHSRFVGWCSL